MVCEREAKANEITQASTRPNISLYPNVDARKGQNFAQQGQRSNIISQTFGVILVTTFLASCTECEYDSLIL